MRLQHGERRRNLFVHNLGGSSYFFKSRHPGWPQPVYRQYFDDIGQWADYSAYLFCGTNQCNPPYQCRKCQPVYVSGDNSGIFLGLARGGRATWFLDDGWRRDCAWLAECLYRVEHALPACHNLKSDRVLAWLPGWIFLHNLQESVTDQKL